MITTFYCSDIGKGPRPGWVGRCIDDEDYGYTFERYDQETKKWIPCGTLSAVRGFDGGTHFNEITPDEAQKLAGDGVNIFPDVAFEQGARP